MLLKVNIFIAVRYGVVTVVSKGNMMNKLLMNLAVVMLLLLSGMPSFANNGKALGKDKEKNANNEYQDPCADDIRKAGCSDVSHGKSLMMCLHAYRKTNKNFQLSEKCKSGTLALRDSSLPKTQKNKKDN